MERIRILGIFRKDFLLTIFIILITPWTWKILDNNISLGLLLILITVVLVRLLVNSERNFRLIPLLCLFFAVASIVSLQSGFDRNSFKPNVNEEVRLNKRHNYYAGNLKGFFLNKYSLNFYKNYQPYLNKFERNFFFSLDPNLYFFASHPRERAGVNEFEKYPSAYFFIFILGFIYYLQKRNLIIFFYLLAASFVSGFVSPGFVLGPVILFPFISATISLGLIFLLDLFKEKDL